jgi:hypothetical protein
MEKSGLYNTGWLGVSEMMIMGGTGTRRADYMALFESEASSNVMERMTRIRGVGPGRHDQKHCHRQGQFLFNFSSLVLNPITVELQSTYNEIRALRLLSLLIN